jgi:hypothetical protein
MSRESITVSRSVRVFLSSHKERLSVHRLQTGILELVRDSSCKAQHGNWSTGFVQQRMQINESITCLGFFLYELIERCIHDVFLGILACNLKPSIVLQPIAVSPGYGISVCSFGDYLPLCTSVHLEAAANRSGPNVLRLNVKSKPN